MSREYLGQSKSKFYQKMYFKISLPKLKVYVQLTKLELNH